MTISIHITADPGYGKSIAEQVNEAMAALGFVRAAGLISSIAPINEAVSIGEALSPGTSFTADEINEIDKMAEAFYAAKPTSARIPGQPSPGKSRRTKAEIAEDEAAAKLANHERVASIKADVEAGAAAHQAAYDSPEDAAQDAADEAAETAANKTGLTHDDLRQAAGRYQKKFGMAAAVAGVPALLGCAIVDVPEADLAAAIAKIDAAVAAEGEPAAAEQPAEKPATKDDLVAAMKRYAKKFDGQDVDMNAMPHTMTDCPAIFKLLFGDGVEKLSQVPADGYAKTIAAIDEAIAKNPFKR